ncbi:MAG: SusC/RagA family TonB-linked outer membrane protein [Cyclobacteriaceae bacterium]
MKKILLQPITEMSRNMFYGLVINCLFCILVYGDDANGQASLKETTVSLSVDQKEVGEVFELLTEKTSFDFAFNDANIDPTEVVSLKVKNTSLYDVLTIISKQVSFKFRRIDNNIHVTKALKKSEAGVYSELVEILISGTVTDEKGNSIPGVTISIKGTQSGTISDGEGEFSLNADENSVLLFSFLGYRTQEVAVQGRNSINIVLEEDISNLEEVIVTATGIRRKVEIGNTISRLEVDEDVKIRPINNVSDLLQGQASGVQIFSSGGSAGMGSRIRIRGSNSASLSNEPVIYVDGVLINNQANSISFETGGQSPSRLNDLNPEDIESIEVIKGPSAATLYGSIAANGVIRITTKRGQAGKSRWSAFLESGLVNDVGNYPDNYQALDASGNPGFNFDAARGTFVHNTVNSFQPLNDPATSPFRTGRSYGLGLSVSGGTEELTYFVSGNFSDNQGVLPVNNIRRATFRGNLGAQISDKLKISMTTGFTNSELELPLNDNFSLGLMGQGLNGMASPAVNNGWGEFTPEELFTIDTKQNINRFTSGLQVEWSPYEGIDVNVSGGLDFTSRWDNQFFKTGEAPAFLNYDQGARFSNRFNEIVYTFDAVGSYKKEISDEITTRTSVGFQYLGNLAQGTLSTGLQLVAGTSSIAGAANTFSTEQTTEQRTAGLFFEEQLGFNEKLFVTGAIRSDRGSAFGDALSAVIYPKLSASWLLSDESFFNPKSNWIGSLRLRGAWGASGVQPGTNDALRFFNPVAATVDGGQSVTGVTFGTVNEVVSGVGNADLKPERSREIEFGIDASFLSNRMGLELTYFNKQTEDALVFRQLPQSLGVGTGRFENLGSVQNAGLEVALNTRIVQTDKITFDLDLIGTFFDNELKELGEGIDPVIFRVQRHVEGYPLGGYWDESYTFNDDNGDGFIAQEEVQVGETVYLGAPFATKDLSFIPTLSFFKDRLILKGLMSYRGGQKLYNNTAAWRNGNSNTEELNDPNASLEGQARAVASKFLSTDAGYIEDASFWRLREISLTYNVPKKTLNSLGLSRLSFTVSGQNLGVWTDYTGLDPEISSDGQDDFTGQNNFNTQEFLSQPPVRMWKARLNLSF